MRLKPLQDRMQVRRGGYAMNYKNLNYEIETPR